MSFFSMLAGKVISATANGILVVAIHVLFLFHALMNIPYTPPKQSVIPIAHHTIVVSHATSSVPSAPKPQPPIGQTLNISTSTTQVGEFTVAVTCESYGDRDFDPTNITISKNGSTTQTIDVNGVDVSTFSCEKAGSQDVNFDGYQDITLLTGTGSGGGSVSYWLFSTSTGQFVCNEPYNDCELMNPKFDPATKTVTSEGETGVGSIEIDLYQPVNGQLVQTKHFDGSEEEAIKEGYNIQY